MASKANSQGDGAFFFLKYCADTSEDNPEGTVEVVELTKRQKGLVSNGSVDVMGPKFKPPEDPSSKTHCFAWSEEGAQAAWDDLMHGEPCIYVTPDAVYVGESGHRVDTRHVTCICSLHSCRVISAAPPSGQRDPFLLTTVTTFQLATPPGCHTT